MRTRGVTIAAALLAGIAVAAPAQATTPRDATIQGATTSSDDSLDDYLDTLDPAAREDFVQTMLPATVVQRTYLTPANRAAYMFGGATTFGTAAVACWTQRNNIYGYALAGNMIYSGYHVGGWCANGSVITSASKVDYGGQAHTAGWRFVGRVASDAGVVAGQGRSYSQLKFVLGVNGWDVSTATPCSRIIGIAPAKGKGDMVCGIY